jgi:dGTPase
VPDIEDNLAPYAMPTAASRGRRWPEPLHPFRSLFQRDRERIVHSSAFRRMTGKTQVLVASVNDHHRTRLTHTLEVTQIARTVARRLRLNEDLVEAIALAHDIGHPPYGHAGEQALHECLLYEGGFNHNLYGLRRVDLLEERYPEFPGLNLTFEVREAFVRHAARLDAPEAAEFRGAGNSLLEADVVDAVDSIAYDIADLDDALGLGFVSLADLDGIDLVVEALAVVKARHGPLPADAQRIAMVREVLAVLVSELIDSTAAGIAAGNIRTLDDVRSTLQRLVGHGPLMAAKKAQLERFLHERVYRHPRVLQMTASGQDILKGLFRGFTAQPDLLPERFRRRWAGSGLAPLLPNREQESSLPRAVADYLAGMTDRFAQQEYRRLFSPAVDL